MTGPLSDAVAALLPPQLREEVRANIEAAVRSALQQMNLVTREQLDIQEKVLLRTRERLQSLEAQVGRLEQALEAQRTTGGAAPPPSSPPPPSPPPGGE